MRGRRQRLRSHEVQRSGIPAPRIFQFMVAIAQPLIAYRSPAAAAPGLIMRSCANRRLPAQAATSRSTCNRKTPSRNVSTSAGVNLARVQPSRLLRRASPMAEAAVRASAGSQSNKTASSSYVSQICATVRASLSTGAAIVGSNPEFLFNPKLWRVTATIRSEIIPSEINTGGRDGSKACSCPRSPLGQRGRHEFVYRG